MSVDKKVFVERLHTVLGNRKRHVWGVDLGFTNNRVHRLFQDSEPLPSTEELALIGEAENLNLNWLVYGTGPQYQIQSLIDYHEFNSAVEAMLLDQWNHIFIVVCQSKCALVTCRSKRIKYKSKQVNIQHVNCLVGPGSAQLQSILSRKPSQGVEFPVHRFEELEAGEIGTYMLFGDTRVRGYLEDLERQDIHWLLGNMSLSTTHDEIDLPCLLSCYDKIQSFGKITGRALSNQKITELTWVMYQTELVEQQQSIGAHLASSSSKE